MNVIVTDTGFAQEDQSWCFVAPGEQAANDCAGVALDVASDCDPTTLAPLLAGVEMVRVDFPSFSDGRGFTVAAMLRRMGYAGRLRAKGHVIADQYAMARRAGFDEVEISKEIAARQPEPQWLARADWTARNYQARLRGVLA
ncbi:DUF934 domain-containing protein [Thalassorhabdomicrobium marinisediminis]|uniref:DUF934 domain-containing protein n=1 Tax=Thalassorhabdomicrobium marinisediminis TaxID=2170577 RepID=UPI0024931526|nr:DUF934 domain-containing protein [Thalassorhabdomicrobium marinisediminis]